MKGRIVYNEAKTKAMFVEASGRIRHPLVRLGKNRVCIDERIDVSEVRMDRKKHAKRVRDRMSEVVSKLTRLCRNKGSMNKGKVRAIMERVAEP